MKNARLPQDIADLRYRRAVKKLTRFLKSRLYLIIAAVTAAAFIGIDTAGWDYSYGDSDGYMRALRVYHWMLNPSFFEQPLAESNYPFGEILHWTRPVDILWLVGTLPFLGLSELKDIVFLGGAFIAPWLFVLSSVVLVYGLRRRFNVYLVLFGYCIFLSDPIMQNYFSFGRPDHHALMALLGIYAVSLMLCWFKKRHLRYLRLLGITLALASFAAIEGIILYLLFLGFFILLYVFKNISLVPAVKVAKYFAAALACFWLLNPPYEGWLYPDNGRISILYAAFAWLVFGALYGLELSRLHTRSLKIWSLICCALGIALALLVCFGTDIYHFPLDGEISSIWSSRISEMRPLWKQTASGIFAVYSFAALSLLASFAMLHFKPYRRLMVFNLTLGVPLFALNVLALRFANYQCLYNILPWLCLMDCLYKKSAFAQRRSAEFPPFVWAAALGILLIQQLVFLPYNIIALGIPRTQTFSPQLCQSVKNIGGTLITDNFLSPKYVWLCNVNTVGTPYHRNRGGLQDSHAVLMAEDNNAVIPLLLKHQVTQILLFDSYDNRYYSQTPENANKLYYRLLKRENIPPFLEEIPSFLPNARHYRVRI